MKKTGSKRGSGYDSGPGSAVLDAPEESFALKGATIGSVENWIGRGPAPTGALQRGYGDVEGDAGYGGSSALDEPEYVPQRGSFRLRMGGLPKSITGRILLGVVTFGALSVALMAVVGTRYYLLHDERFVMASSSDIQILGDDHLSRPQVLGVFGADLERNIFRVPLAERKTDLERLPWVEHASVMRLLPDKIRVSITERTPIAFVRQGSQIGLVDAGGVLLDMPPEAAGDPHYSFPVLTGISSDLPLSMRAARMDVYRQFVRDLDGAGEKLTDSLSEVDVSNPEDVKALVSSGSSDILVHFGEEAFLARYREFQQHAPEWKQQYPKLASADMRYEGQIVLEMQGGAGVPLTPEVASATPAAAAATVEKPAATAVSAAAIAPKKAKPAITPAIPIASVTSAFVPAKVTKVKAKAVPVHLGVKPVAKGKGGKSVSNEKVFAALAAAQKARTRAAASAGKVTP